MSLLKNVKILFSTLRGKRPFFTFHKKGHNRTINSDLLEVANQTPNDPKIQAKLYKELLSMDKPQQIIGRFELDKYSKNSECALYYILALYETGQLERITPLILQFKEGTASKSIPSTPSNVLGTPDKPLYILNVADANPWWKRLGTLLNASIIVLIAYSIYSFGEHKLGGLSPRVHKLFNPGGKDKKKGPASGAIVKFSDVHGCDEAKRELQEIVEFLKDPIKFNRLGAKMPKGVLLVGPPGTGKTLLAKAVAGEANVPFIYASGSEFDQMFVGLGSLRIREMFEAAKSQAPAIIFIDELDAVGSKRSVKDPQHSRMSLNQLLIELDGFSDNQGIIVIAATNMADSLDKALLRPGRFDRHVHVPLPDFRGRKSIIEHYLFKEANPLSKDIDSQILARSTPGFSGADLNKLINTARINASREGSKHLSMIHLEASRDEMLLGTERKSLLLTEDDRKLTAFHEGGHALVAHHSQPQAHPIHKATIVPRGFALGFVSQLPERDEVSMSKAQLLARLDVLMGGRAAEELIFGPDKVTTGAGSDFEQATKLARAMVTKYGMSDKVGPLTINDENSPESTPLSQHLLEAIDSETRALLEASRVRAKNIISRNRDALERLADALLKYETLSRKEIESVIENTHGHVFAQQYLHPI
jgi:ATP-dependent metalloprotease